MQTGEEVSMDRRTVGHELATVPQVEGRLFAFSVVVRSRVNYSWVDLDIRREQRL